MKKYTVLCKGAAGLVLMFGAMSAALANTGGGATIHNAATLTYNGGSVAASVDVSVQTVAAQPTAAVTPQTATVPAYGTATYQVKLTSNSNGTDTQKLALSSSNVNTAGSPSISFQLSGSPVTSLTLAASVTSAASGAGVIYIPAGSEVGFAVNQTISVGGNLYTVSAVSVGHIATTSNGVTTAETPSSLTLAPVGSSPAITANLIAAGVQVGQQVTLTEQVVASAPSSSSVTATHTVSFTSTSTATDLSGNAVVYQSANNNANTVTTVTLAVTSLTKYVRNVTRSAGNTNATGAVTCGNTNTYYGSGVVAKTTDTLEYCLVSSVASGQPNMTGAVLKDPLPEYTNYVANSTTMNGAAVADVGGTSAVNTASGLQVKSPSATSAGTIVAGESAYVIFQVTVQ